MIFSYFCRYYYKLYPFNTNSLGNYIFKIGKKKFSKFQFILIFIYIVAFSIIFFFLLSGTDFYLTTIMERPHHPDYRSLRPAGLKGHGFGVIGSLMMLLMLLYSVRKRTRLFKNFGFLSHWLQLHIFLGITGPLLIVLHSSFKVHGLIAVSFWSMVAVALSGVLGRYLYIQIPRTISGKELSLEELAKMDQEITVQLQNESDLDDQQTGDLLDLITQPLDKKSASFISLMQIIFADILRPIRYFQLKRQIAKSFKIKKQLLHRIAKILLKKEILERRIRQWSTVHQLFHYWHVIHKPFAILMYVIMFIHILVAVYVGYIWIF